MNLIKMAPESGKHSSYGSMNNSGYMTQLDIVENRKHLNYSRMTYVKRILWTQGKFSATISLRV